MKVGPSAICLVRIIGVTELELSDTPADGAARFGEIRPIGYQWFTEIDLQVPVGLTWPAEEKRPAGEALAALATQAGRSSQAEVSQVKGWPYATR